jgi:hypothetical protein
MTGRMTEAIKKSEGEYACGFYRYVVSVIAPAVLILGLFIALLLKVAGGHSTNMEQTGIAVLAIMLFFTVLSANQPFAFVVDGEKIRIKSYWKRMDYYWKDLNTLKVKEFGFVDRVYIRIGASRLLSGRYWLDVHMFSNGKSLMGFLRLIEGNLHPDRVMYQKVDLGAKSGRRR